MDSAFKTKFLAELKAYVALPSVSADPKYSADCAATARWVAAKLARMGLASRLVPTAGGKGKPLVMGTYTPKLSVAGKVKGNGKKNNMAGENLKSEEERLKEIPHLLIYGHYDVQPPEPLELWKTPPFQMTQIGGKLFGRGVADDKSSVLAVFAGLEAALKNNPQLKITCLIEGEEESHSHLPETLLTLKKSIGRVDLVALSDTTSPSPDDLAITSGVRGTSAFELKIRGLARDLHSGYGGAVPNAPRELARVLGGLHDEEGWVTLPHFYDGVQAATHADLKNLREIYSTKDFSRKNGLKGYYPMSGKTPAEVMCFFPSLEMNGLAGGYQGEGPKTIIPATALAKITCRIAPGQNPLAFQKNVMRELRKRVNSKLFSGEVVLVQAAKPAYAVPLSEPRRQSPVFSRALKILDASCRSVMGKKLLYIRDGASIPILGIFKKIFGADSLALGLYLEESHIHSPNENVEIRQLDHGIKIWERFFTQMG